MNINGIILIVLLVLFFILMLYKEYRKSETIDEKGALFLLVLVFFTPIIVYYLDKYDVPSKLTWFSNIDLERWFSFFTTYISSIFSAIIGAMVLILMTIHQMDRQDKKDIEILRINNLPLLSYKISDNKGKASLENLIITDSNRKNFADFELKITNLGLSAVRKAFIIFSSKENDNLASFWLADGGCIDKNKSITIYKYLSIPDEYVINVTLYYCDLINNWYEQKVIITLKTINRRGKKECNRNITINNERLIKEEPKELIKNL